MLAAFYVDGRDGCFGFSGERDADVGVFGFAGAVDDAAHDGDFEVFYAGVFLAPFGHFLTDVVVYLFGELLVEIAVGAAAARATGY